MTTKSIGIQVTVAEAIKAGKRKAYWPALAILFGVVILFFPMEGYVHIHPLLLLCLILGIGIVASWAWWAYHIVAWRFWAVANVQDLYKLEAKALNDNLIHNGLHQIGKLEIANAETRIRYQRLYQKHLDNVQDEVISDPLLPKEVALHYSWWSRANNGILIIISFYILTITLASNGPLNARIFMLLFGFVLLGLSVYELFQFFLKKDALPHALKITSQWIQFEQEPPVWWKKVNMAITTKTMGKHSRFYIELYTEEDIIRWEVTDLNISRAKLDHYLDVFRTRAKNKDDNPIT